MQHFPIKDHHPPYTALSYSIHAAQWTGVFSQFGYMYCNGKEHHVKDGLLHILAKILDPSRTTYLWIDQICINQPDEDELRRQQEMMQDIYSNAAQTIIWLGYPEDNQLIVNGAFAALHRHFVQFSSAQDANEIKRRTAAIHISQGAIFTAHEEMYLVNILRRPWFSRVWVIQEATLSRNAIVQCGTFRISWTDFLLHVACLKNTGMLNSLLAHPDPSGESTSHQWEVRYQAFLHLHAMYESNFNGPAWQVISPVPLPKFKHLLPTTRLFEVTKPRDRVYAIRGLCDDKEAIAVRIEESYTLADLHYDVAKYLISQESAACQCDSLCCPRKEMSILGSAGIRDWSERCFRDFSPHDIGSLRNLPSWVPIWAGNSLNSIFFSADEAGYKAAGNTPPIIEVDETAGYVYGKLKVEGVIIDEPVLQSRTCTSTTLGDSGSKLIAPRPVKLLSKFRVMGYWLQELLGLARLSIADSTSSRTETFCRTLCANMCGGNTVTNYNERKPIPRDGGAFLIRSFQDYMAVFSLIVANWHLGVQYLGTCEHQLRAHRAGNDY